MFELESCLSWLNCGDDNLLWASSKAKPTVFDDWRGWDKKIEVGWSLWEYEEPEGGLLLDKCLKPRWSTAEFFSWLMLQLIKIKY